MHRWLTMYQINTFTNGIFIYDINKSEKLAKTFAHSELRNQLK